MTDHPASLLPERGSCTGCGACASGCPKGAIHMLPDREGFLYPTVTDACIQCGHCAHICPVRKQREPRPEPAVFAAWNPDAAVRQASTAGGVFSLLAEYILDEGGVVFGAALDEELQVRHIAVKDKAELPRIRGAKPVQSDLGDSFRRVRHYLDQGRRVLFSGTPCQVDGLYHFLGEHPERLLTCDVVCSGVSSPGVWSQLVRSMAYIKRQPPVAVSFCGKLPGEKERRFHVRFDGGAQYDAPFGKSDFGRGLRQRLFLRPVCHRCPYASTDRPADLTDLCLIEQAHLVFAQNIGLLLTGLAEAGSLRIGKDLIHVLQLPLQLCVFPLQCFYRLDQRADELRDFRGSICDFPVCCGHEFSSQNGFNLPLLYHKGRLKYRNICNFRNIFVRIDPSVFLCG